MPNNPVGGLNALPGLNISQEGHVECAIEYNSENLSIGDGTKVTSEKPEESEISWGATDDKKNAARIIESVVKQETGKMEERDEGLWIVWDKWFNWNLIKLVRGFKKGHFKIKRNEKANRLFNVIIGSPVSNPLEKEILRRGLKIYLEFKSRYENGNTKLSRFHAILMSGIYSDRVFIVFDADKLGFSLSEVSTMEWSFVWHDKSGKQETYQVGRNWEIVRKPGIHMPKNPKIYGGTLPGTESEMGVTKDNKYPQTRVDRKKGKMQPSIVPDVPLESEDLESKRARPVDSADELSTWEAFMKTPWAEESMKLAMGDVVERAQQLGVDLGCIPANGEAMIKTSTEQLSRNLVAMAIEDPEKHKDLQMAAQRILSESGRVPAQAEGSKTKRGGSRT